MSDPDRLDQIVADEALVERFRAGESGDDGLIEALRDNAQRGQS